MTYNTVVKKELKINRTLYG